jgi:hypothetical protein
MRKNRLAAGRKPIGTRPMTPAERSRRWRRKNLPLGRVIRMRDALLAIEVATDWYRLVQGVVSHDDLHSAIRETMAVIDQVRDIIDEGKVYGPEWTK